MSGEEATAAIYELKNVECTALEWESQVKNSLLDYIGRLDDIGDSKRLEYAKKQYWRLEKVYEPATANTTVG